MSAHPKALGTLKVRRATGENFTEVTLLHSSGGLGVTEAVEAKFLPSWHVRRWMVTHLNAGVALAGGPYTEATARQLLAAVVSLAPWESLDLEALKKLARDKGSDLYRGMEQAKKAAKDADAREAST